MDGNFIEQTLRPATAEDAEIIMQGFEMAGSGMPEHFWNEARKPGQSLADVALSRMRDKIADPDQTITIAGDGLGAIISYDIPDEPEPLEGLRPLIRPLVVLENQAPGTHYINMLAVQPHARRLGLGRLLIASARRAANGKPLSLTVDDTNTKARALYDSEGFVEIAREPLVSDGWQASGNHFILMIEGI